MNVDCGLWTAYQAVLFRNQIELGTHRIHPFRGCANVSSISGTQLSQPFFSVNQMHPALGQNSPVHMVPFYLQYKTLLLKPACMKTACMKEHLWRQCPMMTRMLYHLPRCDLLDKSRDSAACGLRKEPKKEHLSFSSGASRKVEDHGVNCRTRLLARQQLVVVERLVGRTPPRPTLAVSTTKDFSDGWYFIHCMFIDSEIGSYPSRARSGQDVLNYTCMLGTLDVQKLCAGVCIYIK